MPEDYKPGKFEDGLILPKEKFSKSLTLREGYFHRLSVVSLWRKRLLRVLRSCSLLEQHAKDSVVSGNAKG